MKKNYSKLVSAAKDALKKSYSPYSRIKVGVAALGASGKVYTGVNVENASYGLTICAERAAVFNAVTGGEKKIKAVAIVWNRPGFAVPCGACRQVIAEFGKDADIVMASKNGKYKVAKLSKLLPSCFSL